MSQKLSRRKLLLVAAGSAAGTLLAACAGTPAPNTTPKADAPKTEDKPAAEPIVAPTAAPEPTIAPTSVPEPTAAPVASKVEYSVLVNAYVEKQVNNPNDVVTPYLEEKGNAKVTEARIPNPDQSTKEQIALFKAAGNMPDVIVTNQQFAQELAVAGEVADLTDYLKDMPNYSRFINEKFWPRFETNGRRFVLPQPILDVQDKRFNKPPLYDGYSAWSLWAREDILKAAGYKFTPLAELEKTTTAKGRRPTIEELAIEPAIDTPEKFTELLQKIKALDLKVGDKPMIPLSTSAWSVFHISTMMDVGHWRRDSKGEIAGWLGSPDAKAFYKLWSEWYRDSLLDNDYVTQKDDQLQEKIASGRVAVGMYAPDLSAARQAVLGTNPDAMIRPIQWPKKDKALGYFDIFENGFWCYAVRKDYPDIAGLMKFWDYLCSDEALEIQTWGPESAGLWEIKDGKKQFKAEVVDDIRKDKADGKNAQYYGIGDISGGLTSKLAACTPVVSQNPFTDWRFNYPVDLKIVEEVPKVYGSVPGSGLNTTGTASYGDGSETTNAIGNYFWSKFVGGDIAKLLTSTDDVSFDAAWDEIYSTFLKEGKYEESQRLMVKWFDQFGAK